jgi:hypothetical protein
MADAEAEPFRLGDIELHIGTGSPSATGVDQHRPALTQAGGEATGIAIADIVAGSNQHHIDCTDEGRDRPRPCRWFRRYDEESFEYHPGFLGRDEPEFRLAYDRGPRAGR